MLYAEDAVKAGELAIAAIELVLTGETSTDDAMIKIMLQSLKVVSERNTQKYQRKIEAQRQKRIEDNRLTDIAAQYLQGKKQNEIAISLGISQQSVSYWIQIIKKDYPELLDANKEESAAKKIKNAEAFKF